MTRHHIALLAVRCALVVICLFGLLVTGSLASWSTLLTVLPAAVFAAVGWLVSRRQPRNAIGWLFLAVAAGFGLLGASIAVTAEAVHTAQLHAWWAATAAWAYNFLWVLVVAPGFALTLQLFPSGLPSRRWGPLLWTTLVATIGVAVASALAPRITFGDGGPEAANPVHAGLPAPVLGVVFGTGLGVLVITCLLSVVSAVLRFHRADGIERAQMRWLAFSGVILAVVLFFPRLNESDLASGLAFALVPASCGVAILRYRLYDIDRIISRTTSYAIVTSLVLATYAFVVTVVLRLLPDSSSVAVATATLAAAAVVRPAVRRVQAVVDRRFDRARYDQIRTLEAFGHHVRDLVDPDDVSRQLLVTVRTALQPATTSVWSGSA